MTGNSKQGSGSVLRQANFRTLVARTLVATALVAALGACASKVKSGHLPDPELVAQIEPGVHSRRDVASILGSPSVLSTFDDKAWYYVSSTTEKLAFFKPDIVDQQVLAIYFDNGGLVQETRHFDLEDAQDIDPVGRETPTEGRKLTIIQQLLGNVGRFSE